MSAPIRGRSALRRIAERKLRTNRAQSWVAGCAIALTTLLLTAIFTLGLSLNKSMELTAMKTSGSDYHGSFKKLTPEQAERLAGDRSIVESSQTVYIGRLQSGPLADSPLEVVAADDHYPKHAFVRFEAGGMPREADEIALSSWALEALGAASVPGTPLKLSVTLGDGSVLERTFRLSGWYKADRYLSGGGGGIGGVAYTSQAFAKTQLQRYDPAVTAHNGTLTGSYQLYVRFGSSWKIEERLNQVMQRTGVEAEYGVNWAYTSESLWKKPMEWLPYAVLLLIVLLSGYLLIYNIFHIAVVRDVKFYGLLKTIGTSPRQIRRVVAAQCNRLYLLALAPGLLLGYAVGALLSPYVASLASDVDEPSYSANPLIFVGAALFAYVTVRLSAGRPARTASSVSPVEAAGYVGLPSRSRKLRPGTRGAKPLRMSWNNLSRSPRRLAIMLGSLSLSLILFSIVNNVIGSVSTEKYLNHYIAGDWMIRDESQMGTNAGGLLEAEEAPAAPGLTPALAKRLEEVPGVSSADRVYGLASAFDVQNLAEAASGQGGDLRRTGYPIERIAPSNDLRQVPAQIYGIGNGLFDLLRPDDIRAGSFNKKTFATGQYALVRETYRHGAQKPGTYYLPGDIIKLPGSSRAYQVMAVIRSDAFYSLGTRFYTAEGFAVYLPDTAMKQAYPEASLLAVSLKASAGPGGERSAVDARPSADAQLRSLTSGAAGLSMRSREDYRQELTGFLKVFRLVGYSLCFIVALIGLLNYANTILTGIMARRRELAAMQSVGMTNRQLRHLLFAEGIWIAALTAALVLSLGTLSTYGVVRFLTANMAFTVFRLNMLPTALLLLLLLVAAYAISRLACRMLSAESITDRLRESV